MSTRRPLFAAASAYAPVGVVSPCVGVCKMDDATGWCQGCLRSIDEIAHWGLYDDDEKRAVIDALPARRAAPRG